MVPAVYLVDPTARAKWSVGALGGVSQVMHGPPTRVDITVGEEIWNLTVRQAIGSSVMCESVAEREYE